MESTEILKNLKKIKQKIIFLNKKNRIYDCNAIHDDKKTLILSIDELIKNINNPKSCNTLNK